MTSSACKPASTTSDSAQDRSAIGFPLAGRRAAASRFAVCDEPSLAEIMEDPILRRLMASDGVRTDHLLAVIADARAKVMARQQAEG